MRISDWSSDVCSSDLPSEVALILPPAIYVALLQRRNRLAAVLVLASLLSYSALTFVGLIATLVCFIWTIRGFRPLHVAAVLVVMAGARYMVEPIRDRVQWVIQIGRASCRERVCQYV